MSQFADQLTIDTPEQVELHLPVASVGSRLLAVLTDTLIQFFGTLALVLTLMLILSALPAASAANQAVGASLAAGKWVTAGLILVQFLLIWGYFSLFEAFWNGQTPGKRLLKIRVIQDSGRPVTLFESLARNLLRAVDFLPSIYLAGLVTMLCNRRGKRLGDLLAGTLVVHERESLLEPMASSRTLLPLAAPSLVRAAPRPAAAASTVPADAAARLEPADARVLEAFFARHLDLPLEVRSSMAAGIAERLAKKMQWSPVDIAEHPERFLEQLLFALRDR